MKWEILHGMMITVYSVTLTWAHVVAVLMVNIVETGISLMELDCHSRHLVVVFMKLVEINELTYVVTTMLTHHLVYIAVILQPMLSLTT